MSNTRPIYVVELGRHESAGIDSVWDVRRDAAARVAAIEKEHGPDWAHVLVFEVNRANGEVE